MNTTIERISKFISRAGFCSRREAEKLVRSGQVKINDFIVTDVTTNVAKEDQIYVDGKKIEAIEGTRLWIHYKPNGVVSTHSKTESRPTLFEQLPEGFPRVVSVGRLDMFTEGVIVLTNDGDLAHLLETHSPTWIKEYELTLEKSVSEAQLKLIKEKLSMRKYTVSKTLSFTTQVEFTKMHRQLFESTGSKIKTVVRRKTGPFSLGKISPGDVLEVESSQIELIKKEYLS
ncbi:MAG: 23S rRNA pseudouridine2605 synthase [Candidatus Marinamargulisbacteria bacterium]|jgi:23S rRNA pseudouridine2605 synthase